MLPEGKRELYDPPKHDIGSSDIGFDDTDGIRNTLAQLRGVWEEGNEIGTHFNGHFCGPEGGIGTWTVKQWKSEIGQAKSFVKNWKANVPVLKDEKPLLLDYDKELVGGRTPCLEGWNGGTYMRAVVQTIARVCTRKGVRCVSFRQLADWLDAQDPAVLAKLATLDVGRAPAEGWLEFLGGTGRSRLEAGANAHAGRAPDGRRTGRRGRRAWKRTRARRALMVTRRMRGAVAAYEHRPRTRARGRCPRTPRHADLAQSA